MSLQFVKGTVIPPLPSTERGQGIQVDGTTEKEKRILYGSNNLVIARNVENWNQALINPDSHAKKVKVAKFNVNSEFIVSGDESGYWDCYPARLDQNGMVVSSYPDLKPKYSKCINDIAWDGEPKIDQMQVLFVGSGDQEFGVVFIYISSHIRNLSIYLLWNRRGKRILAKKGGKGVELTGISNNLICCDYSQQQGASWKEKKEARLKARIICGDKKGYVYIYKNDPQNKNGILRCGKRKVHTNSVNCIKFNPQFTKFVSVGSDKKVIGWDVEKLDGDIKDDKDSIDKEFADGKGKDNQHKGGIYAVSWSPDGKQFLTSSADKTCKIWDYESGQVVFTYTFADKPSPLDMQVSCYWLDASSLYSISLKGRINCLDPQQKEERPIRIITGHRKPVQDIAYDSKRNTIYTCDNESFVVKTDCKTYDPVDCIGNPHNSTQIKFISTTCDNSAFYTVASNDTLCRTEITDDGGDEKKDGSSCTLGDKTIKLDGAARGFSTGNKDPNLLIVPIHKKKIYIINGLNVEKTVDIKYEPKCCCLSADDKYLCVGSGQDDGYQGKIFIYEVDALKQGKAEPVMEIKSKNYIRGEILCLSMTADTNFLASADRDRNIWIWDTKKKETTQEKDGDVPVNEKKGMKYHNGQISSIEFGGAEGKQLLTCANDSKIYLWTNPTEGQNENICMKQAFIGLVKKATFIDVNKVAAIGGDQTIRFFDIKPK